MEVNVLIILCQATSLEISKRLYLGVHEMPASQGNANKSAFPYIFTFLNACISVKTRPINTKLGDFVNLGVLFLTKWINSC